MNTMTKTVLIAALVTAVPAAAVDVASGTVVLSAADAQQLGRLSRDGIVSDWSAPKAFPGVINTSTSYAYTTVDTTFAANRKQTIYYGITVDDPTNLAFVSAYGGTYDPLAKNANYLGDPGTSGNYFLGTDALFFAVTVAAGGSLELVFNQTSAGSFSPGTNYLVQAFSDTEYNEVFAAVPEAATWAMLVVGFGMVGAAVRSRRTRVAIG
ncbi:MAG: PEPxxWA-CTERM sorting domain-containing protein [Janthinobacterium lividum]